MSAEPIAAPEAAPSRPEGIPPHLHPGSGHEEVPRYRRRRVVTSHRQPRRSARLLRLLVVLLLVLVTPLLLAGWLLTSPRFGVAQFRVDVDPTGTGRVSEAWVVAQLEGYRGQNLMRLSLEDVRLRLEAHRWVAAAAVGKELPDALRVELLERRPAALVESADGLLFVDGDGAPIEVCCLAEAAPPLLRIGGAVRSAEDASGALAVAAELQRIAAPWGSGLERVEVLGVDNYRLELPTLPFALLVRAGSLEAKSQHLNLLFPELVARYTDIEAVDLRFRQRVVVRPAGERGTPSEYLDRG